MVTSNSMLANPTSNPSVSFLLSTRPFTVIPYICEMHCPANVIMMVAVVLAPNRHQCIANHHRDPCSISGFTSSHQHNIHIPLWPLNKQYLWEVGSSATCCWLWVRLRTRIMPYHQFMLSTHHPFLALRFNINWQDYCIWNQFYVQFDHITAQFLFLTIKFGKIKWRFSSCNCFNFFFKFMQLVTFCFKL